MKNGRCIAVMFEGRIADGGRLSEEESKGKRQRYEYKREFASAVEVAKDSIEGTIIQKFY